MTPRSLSFMTTLRRACARSMTWESCRLRTLNDLGVMLLSLAYDLAEGAFGIIYASQRKQHDSQVIERAQARRSVVIKLEGAPDVDDRFGHLSTEQKGGPQ